MARPRKIHEGNNVLVECVIRVPGKANQSATFEITNFASRLLPRLRVPESIEQQIRRGLDSVYGQRGVRVRHDISGSG
jgi:hypothetical protein